MLGKEFIEKYVLTKINIDGELIINDSVYIITDVDNIRLNSKSIIDIDVKIKSFSNRSYIHVDIKDTITTEELNSIGNIEYKDLVFYIKTCFRDYHLNLFLL